MSKMSESSESLCWCLTTSASNRTVLSCVTSICHAQGAQLLLLALITAVQLHGQAAVADRVYDHVRSHAELLICPTKEEVPETEAKNATNNQPQIEGHNGQHEKVTPDKLHDIQQGLDDVPFV